MFLRVAIYLDIKFTKVWGNLYLQWGRFGTGINISEADGDDMEGGSMLLQWFRGRARPCLLVWYMLMSGIWWIAFVHSS